VTANVEAPQSLHAQRTSRRNARQGIQEHANPTQSKRASSEQEFFVYLFCLVIYLAINRTLYQQLDPGGGSRLDLLGYWSCLLVGIFLSSVAYRHHLVNRKAVHLYALYAFYLMTIVFSTGSDVSLLGFTISRNGVVLWAIIGFAVGVALRFIALNRESVRVSWIHTVTAVMHLGLIGQTMNEILSDRMVLRESLSYQYSASLLTILFVIVTAWNLFAYNGRPPSASIMVLVPTGAVLATTVAKSGSVAVVPLWLGVIATYALVVTNGAQRHGRRFVFLCFVLASFWILIQSSFFRSLLTETKYATLFSGGGSLSSVSSRRALVATFGRQFAVDPVVGNFRAEEIAGLQPGEWVHSLILSSLTHTGIVGSILLLFLVTTCVRVRSSWRNLPTGERYLQLLSVPIFVYGVMAVFLTWIVFWFLLGLLASRPVVQRRSTKRELHRI